METAEFYYDTAFCRMMLIAHYDVPILACLFNSCLVEARIRRGPSGTMASRALSAALLLLMGLVLASAQCEYFESQLTPALMMLVQLAFASCETGVLEVSVLTAFQRALSTSQSEAPEGLPVAPVERAHRLVVAGLPSYHAKRCGANKFARVEKNATGTTAWGGWESAVTTIKTTRTTTTRRRRIKTTRTTTTLTAVNA